MFKRVLGLVMVLALAVALLPSTSVVAQEGEVWCGTDEEVEITFIAGTVGGEHEVYQGLVDRFMADVCPNITVNLVERPESTTDTLAQYQQFFEGESNELDLFMVDVVWPAMIAEHLLDINDLMDADMLARFYPALIDAYTVEGRLVALPWFAGGGMLYYRTDLLEKYGLEAPATWDDLAVVAKTIQDGERAEGNENFWGFVFQGKAYEGLTCDALEWQVSSGGGRILSPEGVIEVNDEASIEIFDKVASWVGDFVPPEVVTYQEEESRAVWQAGNAAFMRNWAYAFTLAQAEDSVIRDLFGVSPLPGKEPGMTAATLGGWGLSVSKYSDNPEAAVALANWLTEYDALVEFHLARGEQPVLPALYEDEELQAALPYLAFTSDILTAATPRPGVAGEQYAVVSELYYTAVNEVLAGNVDAATAMADLELALADLGFEFP
ncbi:MAG: ABC transporter substrate-binding protein [Anaerolineae bacterium]|nr:ABC transporter substrate-binding protein [Anaerolineae bacterium]